MSAICTHADNDFNLKSYVPTADSDLLQWPYLVWWSGLGSQTTLIIPGSWTGTGDGWNADFTVWDDGDGDTITVEAGSYADGSPYTVFYFILSTPSLDTAANISDGTTTYALSLETYSS